MSFKINNIARNLTRMLNFSPNLITNDITVTIYGGYQAVITGYKKILVYDDNIFIVCSNEKQLKLTGSNLVLSEMSEDGLIINGNIKSSEFEEHRRS